jgi:pilus assembly protein Flp/PilA
MREKILELFIRVQGWKSAMVQDQSGQDLIEYALVATLISLAATAGMSSVAVKISSAFTAAGTKLATYTS